MACSTIATERLRSRDLSLFLALWEGRFVSTHQAGCHIWEHMNSARRRLKQLAEAGFIHLQRIGHLRMVIVRPTKRAFVALAERRLISADEFADHWTWKHLHQRTIGHVAHEAQVNEVRFVLLDACRERRGMSVASCRSGPPIWMEFEFNQRQWSLRPDRRVELAVAATAHPQVFFIEVDRGTKPVTRSKGWDVQTQLARYDQFYLAAQTSFRVLVLVPSKARLDHIMETMGVDRPLALGRAYAIWDEFVADPLGALFQREADGKFCSLTDRWPDWETY